MYILFAFHCDQTQGPVTSRTEKLWITTHPNKPTYYILMKSDVLRYINTTWIVQRFDPTVQIQYTTYIFW
jgi:hypothetical protein